jgi:5-methylcytosine-specific restriction endonuclease McrA
MFGLDKIRQLQQIQEDTIHEQIEEGNLEFEDIVPYISTEKSNDLEVVTTLNDLNMAYTHHPTGSYWLTRRGNIFTRQKRYNTKRFKDPEYVEWRTEVMITAGFKCQKCNAEDAKHCHHILNYSEYPELRFERSNGILFCKKCHNKFHKIYGTRFNDEKQLLTFLLGVD